MQERAALKCACVCVCVVCICIYIYVYTRTCIYKAWRVGWCGKGCVKRHVSLFCGQVSYPLDHCKIAHKHIYNATESKALISCTELKLWMLHYGLCWKRILTLQRPYTAFFWILGCFWTLCVGKLTFLKLTSIKYLKITRHNRLPFLSRNPVHSV